MKVFEFGSGNSTLFFAGRVNFIESVEHDKNWHEKVSRQSPANSKIIYAGADRTETYLNPLKTNKQKFDIIIIDSIYRNDCLTDSISYLSEIGVVILDDSERTEYAKGIDKLMHNGFNRIDFWGISPGYLYKKSTTIFYKNINCLNI
jgi:hypothetical protein